MKRSKERIFYKEIENGAYIIAFATISPAEVRQWQIYHLLEDIYVGNCREAREVSKAICPQVKKLYEAVFEGVKITIYRSPDNFLQNGLSLLDSHVRENDIAQSVLEFEFNGQLDEEIYKGLENALRKKYASEFNSWENKYYRKICETVEKEKAEQEKPNQEKPLRKRNRIN